MNKKEKIIYFILICVSVTILSCVSTYATNYLYNASEVSYDNTNSGIESDNVQGAMEKLYEEATNYSDMKKLIYPVGSVYISVTDDTVAKVQERFGGTWVVFGQGRTLVGVDTSDGDFNTVQKASGSKTHNHKGYGNGGDLRAAIGSASGRANTINFIATGAVNPNTGSGAGNGTYMVTGSTQTTSQAFSHYTPVYGYTSSTSSLQPYITVYMYKRTA